ncbi:response regulator [Chromobacterium haemolyticum]|uniref:response regulator n=1 Tax=Chromobacterium haemolyticum TaxID=394935 RepID=UPI000DEEC365|nr:response regulator [Chromobacterium haemolyticum]
MSKALVVDDHPAQRFIIRRFLEDAGYAVVDVSSARLALEEVSNHLDESFSLIVCDLKNA